jgi:hypothetical protein
MQNLVFQLNIHDTVIMNEWDTISKITFFVLHQSCKAVKFVDQTRFIISFLLSKKGIDQTTVTTMKSILKCKREQRLNFLSGK